MKERTDPKGPLETALFGAAIAVGFVGGMCLALVGTGLRRALRCVESVEKRLERRLDKSA